MTAADGIVFYGPGPATWIAFGGGCFISGVLTAAIIGWGLLRFPVPAHLAGQWRMWWKPSSVAAIVRVTVDRAWRVAFPMRDEEDEPTIQLPRQRAGGSS